MVARIAARLAEIVGSAHVSSVEADRASCGDPMPALVVWPGAAREVAQVLRACDESGTAVGIVGGQTRPLKARRKRKWVAVNTRRMADILDIDETSLTVHAQCGIRLRHLAQALQRHAMTLGSFPPCLGSSTLGGALACPLPRAHSPLTGRLEESCMAVSLACLDGKVLHTRVAPRRATGPDLSRLYVGSGGRLGAITTAVLRVRRIWEQELPVVQIYKDMPQAMEAARQLLVRGVQPARLEVLNAEQAAVDLSSSGFPLRAVCVALLVGPEAHVTVQSRLLSDIAREFDGSELPQKVADTWWNGQQHLLDAEAAEFLSEDPCPDAERSRLRCSFELRYSDTAAVLAQLPSDALRIRVDNLSLRGGRLWLDGDCEDIGEALSKALPPRRGRKATDGLLDQLRRVFDPRASLLGQTRSS